MGLFRFNNNGETHEEGRRGGQVRHPLWRVAPQDHQEDGDHAALQVYVLVLRQGEHEARRRWHLRCTTKNCRIKIAGGAWTLSTAAGSSVRSAIRRLRETKEL